MFHIVIDGYNYLNKIRHTPIDASSSIDILRKAILDRLARYKKKKHIKFTVVFDAYNSPFLTRQRENYMGIDVIYSKKEETADDIIIDMIRGRPSRLIVVTSDRKIIDEAKLKGVTFLTPSRFDVLMEEEKGHPLYGKDEEEDERREKKKGNPRRLPKKIRKAIKTVEEL
ncbi:MAG: NYN domain-containing protein [Syntrophorhabdaceae bacterium]|nr:NYN domain-containing protein [Syntrophorhabdaceae bacterium]